MLKSRDFLGIEFYAFCQQEFDASRNYLRNCGRPKDDYDLFMIRFHKQTVEIFKGYLK